MKSWQRIALCLVGAATVEAGLLYWQFREGASRPAVDRPSTAATDAQKRREGYSIQTPPTYQESTTERTGAINNNPEVNLREETEHPASAVFNVTYDYFKQHPEAVFGENLFAQRENLDELLASALTLYSSKNIEDWKKAVLDVGGVGNVNLDNMTLDMGNYSLEIDRHFWNQKIMEIIREPNPDGTERVRLVPTGELREYAIYTFDLKIPDGQISKDFLDGDFQKGATLRYNLHLERNSNGQWYVHSAFVSAIALRPNEEFTSENVTSFGQGMTELGVVTSLARGKIKFQKDYPEGKTDFSEVLSDEEYRRYGLEKDGKLPDEVLYPYEQIRIMTDALFDN